MSLSHPLKQRNNPLNKTKFERLYASKCFLLRYTIFNAILAANFRGFFFTEMLFSTKITKTITVLNFL